MSSEDRPNKKGNPNTNAGGEEEFTQEYAEEKHDLLLKNGDRKASKSFLSDIIPAKRKTPCPDYFGVKSYLHNFYDSATYKDPSIYEEDDDFRYLLNPNARRRRCPPIWLKICVWLGVNLLLFGIIGILVGYLVPPKAVFQKVQSGENMAYVDKGAMKFNTALDVFKLMGLILFCVGGILLATVLIFPSFMTNYCSEDNTDEAIRVNLGEEKVHASPVEMTIPATSKVKSVQPPWSSKQSNKPPPENSDVDIKD